MKPLLKIQSVPIKIEAQTKRASLQHSTEPPRVNVTRNRGRANIRTTPPKVNIDSTQARASVGMKSTSRVISEMAQNGKMASREASANYGQEGRMNENPNIKNAVAEIAASKVGKSVQSELTFAPSSAPEISVESGSISFDYQMDRLTFDWNVNTKPQLEFVPASIEFSVVQYPQLIIEYVGDPIYVPASANPDYVPPPGINETA